MIMATQHCSRSGWLPIKASWVEHLMLLLAVVQPALGVLTPEVWTAWSSWSDCSFTCGRGVRSRYRECVGHTPSGLIRLQNPTCPGRARQYVVCDKPACPPGGDDERESQCSEHNTDEVLNTLYHWVPFYGGPNSCELTCLARGYSFYYNFGRVRDGTPCKRGSDDLCVSGHCAKVGCDNHVGSNKEIDKCGVCGGQNANCVFFRRTFSKELPLKGDFGYTEVINIPTGATHLKVKDTSNNYLALADSNMMYIINGNWVIDWPGRYEMAGTTVYYGRSGPQNETLTAHGPIKEDLHLMLIFRAQNPGVSYQFWLPTNKLDQLKQKQHSSTKQIKKHKQSFGAPKGKKPSNIAELPPPDVYNHARNRKLAETKGKSSRGKSNHNELHQLKSVHPGEGHTYGEDSPYGSLATNRHNIPHPNTTPRHEGGRNVTNTQAWWQAIKRKRAKDIGHGVNPQLDDVNQQNYITARQSGHIDPTAAMTTKQPLMLRKNKNKGRSHKKKSNNIFTIPASCPPCRKVKQRAKHFCTSKFAIHVKILQQEERTNGNVTRYDIKIFTKYRDDIGLLLREYIWVSNRCRCPRFINNKEYIIMGNIITEPVTREGRLQLTRHSFVRSHNAANDKRLRNLARNVNCDKYG